MYHSDPAVHLFTGPSAQEYATFVVHAANANLPSGFPQHANNGGFTTGSQRGRGPSNSNSGRAEFSGARHGSGLGASTAIPNPSAYAAGAMWVNASTASVMPSSPAAFLGSLGGASGNSPLGNHPAHLAALAMADGHDTFEVHDNQLKAPVSIRKSDIVPTAGSHRLLHTPQPMQQQGSAAQQQRNAFRICEPFQHGQCLHNDECPDVHVVVDVLQSIRTQMVAWLMTKETEFSETALHRPETTFRVFAADLKEVVDVPISALAFTRGLYVDPSIRAKRSRFGQQSAFALMAAQVPTACGLHSVDPAQCKWGRWCNQAHIDPMWMRMKRGEFENWSKSLEQQFEEMPDENVFVVHDPQTKTSLHMPKLAIAGFSRGLFQGSAKKAPSVCMLYQRGRCTAGACCNQIHVFPECVALLRQYVSDPSGDLILAMREAALRARHDAHMKHLEEQQQQQAAAAAVAAAALSNFSLPVPAVGGIANSGAAGHLNPSARPFVPPGSSSTAASASVFVQPPPSASQPSSGYGADAMNQQFTAPAPQVANSNSRMTIPAVNRSPQLPLNSGSFAMETFQATGMLPPPLAASSTSPPNTPSMRPHSLSASLTSPQVRPGVSPLTDLRTEEDEVFERRRQARAMTPSTPMKQNNPYQQNVGIVPSSSQSGPHGGHASIQPPGSSLMSSSLTSNPNISNIGGHAVHHSQAPGHQPQKPIGVPPSPFHGALPPPVPSPHAANAHSFSETAHVAPSGFTVTNSNRLVPQTPPMQFGWVPQARAPAMATGLPPPPSPFRSSALKTPTSPQYPAPFTPDLSHVQFSPSPLLKSAESMTHMPKGYSLEGFDELHLQHSLSASNHGALPPSAVSSANNNYHHSLPPPATALATSSPQTWTAPPPAATTIRQSQPYQPLGSQQTSSASSSNPSRVGNGTPIDVVR